LRFGMARAWPTTANLVLGQKAVTHLRSGKPKKKRAAACAFISSCGTSTIQCWLKIHTWTKCFAWHLSLIRILRDQGRAHPMRSNALSSAIWKFAPFCHLFSSFGGTV